MSVASAPLLLFPPQKGAVLHVGWTWFLSAVLVTTFGGLSPNIAEAETPSPRLPSTLSSTLQEDVQFLQEETIVTAMRYEQPISEAPSNIYVITAEDIRRSGATDIPTILRRVPGMEVMQMTGAEFNVSVRGNNQLIANKLLVLLDGSSLYQDVQGLVIWKTLPVTLPEIERIEVLKGPTSALYGFNAYDGVVNIITKHPNETTGTQTQIGGGEFDTLTSSAMYSDSVGSADIRLAAGWEQNHKWRDRDSLAFRAYKFNSQMRMPLPHEAEFIVSGHFVENNRYDGPSAGAATLAHDSTNGRVNALFSQPHFLAQLWWDGRWFDSEQLFPAVRNFLEIRNEDGTTVQMVNTHTVNSLVQQDLELRDHRLTLGANYRMNTISGNFTRSSEVEHRMGFYAQDEWQMSPHLQSTAGFRYDLDTFINPTLSPRLAVLFKAFPDHSIRTAFEVAYRAPTLIETFEAAQVITTLPSPIPSPPPTQILGSKNLKPERIVSATLGYHGWFLKHRLRIRLDGFYNHVSNLITPTEFGSAFTFVNSGEATIFGGEASVEFWTTTWLEGFANVAYQRIRQTIRRENRRASPHWKVNGGLRGTWLNGFHGELTLHYTGATTYPITNSFEAFAPFGVTVPPSQVGSYLLLNIRAGYTFWNDHAEIAISAFNALNDRHKEHPLGDTIGSRVLGWLTVKLP